MTHTTVLLFPFDQYWWFYGIFTLAVLALLALDLGIANRKAHTISFREATAWSLFWITLALAFNFFLYYFSRFQLPLDERLTALPGFNANKASMQVALEFLAGYLTEYSLSVDNIFVFIVVLRYFAIPTKYQHQVLFYGILGALVFRGLFIATGSLVIDLPWVKELLGAFLVFTGVKLALQSDVGVEPDKNPVLRLIRRLFPVTEQLHGNHFVIREGRRIWITPLLVTLIFLEMTDILFAMDSVPAIFGLTREPLIVFTSNVFAILGLRSMYFMLVGAINKFHLLNYGLAVVLSFVGIKMIFLDRWFGGHFPIGISLSIIIGTIGLSAILSFIFPKKNGEDA